VAAIVLVSTVARAAAARSFAAPWIAPDEMIYGLLGESLWETGQLTVRDEAVGYYSLLYPALVGLPLQLGDLARAIDLAQVLQALVMSSVAVVVFVWGRGFLPVRLAVVAAGLSVLPPALAYSGLLMTEALYYPVVVLALAVLARTLTEPTVFNQGVLLAAVTVAAAVRLQALVLLPVLVTAALLDAWFTRSRASLRQLVPAIGLVVLTVVAGVAAAAVAGSLEWDTLLGAYGTVAQDAPSATRVARELVWHAGDLFLLVLGLPLLATLALAVEAARGRERDPAARAFVATTAAYSLWIVLEVALFASRYVSHVAERYMITAAPPLLLGLCLWIARGAPRPRLVAAAGIVLALAVASIPLDQVAAVTEAHDLFTTMPLLDLTDAWSEHAARAALIVAGAALAATFLLPRRLLWPAVGLLALAFVAVSVDASRNVADLSEAEWEKSFGDASPDWVDRAARGDVVLLNSGDREWTADARTLFWNRRIRRVVRLPDAEGYGPMPQQVVTPLFSGELLDAADRPLAPGYLVAPSAVVPVGEKLAEAPVTSTQPGAALWRVEPPLRLRQRVEGLNPNGDFNGLARISVFGCEPGSLELTLLGKDGQPVEVRVDGVPIETITPAPDTVWEGSVPSPPYADGESRCVYELESDGLVGSTRLEFVPAGG
jgi:hypothetical protein